MNKIALIIPWYGKIPDYFPFFIKGLEFNQDVLDILFFTDIDISYPTPNNFIKINLSWDELVKRLREKIDPDVNIKNPYKLCDFKPMYGRIFETEIKNYDYWGYGDIDLIYGNLKVFLPFDGIENYDVITFRENILHGAFSIFKNNELLINLYKKTNKLKEIVTNVNYIGFDEAARNKDFRSRKRLYNYIDFDNFWDWSTIIQYEADNGKMKLFERYYALEFLLYDSVLRFENGVLKIGEEEYAFFHIVCHKKIFRFIIPKWKVIPNNFHVHSTGFYFPNERFFLLKKKALVYKCVVINLS